MAKPFWKEKKLRDMTPAEWESLCDGCGRCCLIKLEDEDTGEIFTTSVACALYDVENGGCRHYEERFRLMPDCIGLTPDNIAAIRWLPATCAYRLLHEGGDLPPWHPLRSGEAETVRDAGVSILGEALSEADVDDDDLPDHIRDWPDMGPEQTPPSADPEKSR